MVVDRIGDEHPTGVSQSFDPYGDVDAVAIEIIALGDHVAEIDADAQLDAALRFDARVPLRHHLLHLDRTADRVDDPGKFHQHAVAGGLDDAAVVLGDFRIEELAAQGFEAFVRALLIGAHQSRIAGDIGGENCSEAADRRHLRPAVA
jgi:hypothetical protein